MERYSTQRQVSCPGFEKSAPISNIDVSVGSNKVVLLPNTVGRVPPSLRLHFVMLERDLFL